jgi:hypothetical protein
MLSRIKNILTAPRSEWRVIDAESSTVGQLYTAFIVPMAAFAAVMSLLRLSIVGVTVPSGGIIRIPFANGVLSAVVAFLFSLIGLYLVGLVIDVLAPTFAGRKDRRQALKTGAYAFTPAWLGTALTFLPLGPVLSLAASFYGIFLLYLGLPQLMRVQSDQAAGYTASVVICTFAIGILFAVGAATLASAMQS